MAFTFAFFHDSALTQEITSGSPLTCTQSAGGGTGAVDKLIYFGSPGTGIKAQVESNPGVTAISVSVADSNAGTGAPATEIKLASTLIGLDSATAGAALTLSTSVTAGTANAVPIYVRRVSALTVVGTYTDISLTTQSLIQVPV